MYEFDRPNFFVALLESFINQAERSLAYFFAVMVFLLIFLLALFGRDVLYPGMVGVLCLFLIKLRDIIEGYAEVRNGNFDIQYAIRTTENIEKASENLQQMYTAFNETAIAMIAQDFPKKFNPETNATLGSENGLLTYLQSCQKIIEATARIIPEESMRQETKKSLMKMTVSAKNYLLNYLTEKYELSKAARKQIEQISRHITPVNLEVLKSLLEANGVDATTASRAAHGFEIIDWIQHYVKPAETQKKHTEKQKSETNSVGSPQTEPTNA